jgi:hypothetical protein
MIPIKYEIIVEKYPFNFHHVVELFRTNFSIGLQQIQNDVVDDPDSCATILVPKVPRNEDTNNNALLGEIMV